MWVGRAVGRWVLVSGLALGCDAGEKPAAAPTAVDPGSDTPTIIATRSEISFEGRLVSTSEGQLVVRDVVPPGEMQRYVPRFIIDYDCARNTSDGSWQRNTRFDLAAKTRDVVESVLRDGTLEESNPVVTKLTDERVTDIHAAVLVVLSWPGYKAENLGPNGTACALTIRSPYGTQLQLMKSDTKEPDAVSALVKVLFGTSRASSW